MENAKLKSAIELELAGADRQALRVPTVGHADMLLEVLEKSAANGPNARRLADLYEDAKRVRAAFPSEPK